MSELRRAVIWRATSPEQRDVGRIKPILSVATYGFCALAVAPGEATEYPLKLTGPEEGEEEVALVLTTIDFPLKLA